MWAQVLFVSTVSFASPLVLAAIGGFASERSGVINIALEGNMLTGCIATALVGSMTGNPWLGLLGGICAATLLSWLHWLVTQSFRVDHIVSGMGINAIAIGLANFLNTKFTDPNAGEIPVLNTNFYYIAALLLPFLAALYIKFCKGGLRLLAVGSDPSKSRQMGLFPTRIRFVALTATGVLCGVSGALIVTNVKYYTEGMTAGWGYIALAALILGSWRPIPTFLACLLFGLFQALEIQLQGTPIFGVNIPREFWHSMPYIITVVALAGFLGRSKVPAGLGKF